MGLRSRVRGAPLKNPEHFAYLSIALALALVLKGALIEMKGNGFLCNKIVFFFHRNVRWSVLII